MTKNTFIQLAIETANGQYGYKGELDFSESRQGAATEVGRVVIDTIDRSLGGVGVKSGVVTLLVEGVKTRFYILPEDFKHVGLETYQRVGFRIIDAAFVVAEEGEGK